jgi:hypothetical protein
LAAGRWESKQDDEKPRLATSFALLFLTRATPSLNVASKRGGNGTLRTAAAASSDRRIYIILDASGSMIDMMGDKRKFDVARVAVQTLIEGLPDGTEVGLRVYGHRKSSIDQGADQDTELVIPFGPLNKKNFLGKLKALRPRGRTPLTLSLNEARKDLPRAGDPITIVLLTDGGEDTFPRQDPVKAAKEFSKSPNLKLNIVGFDVANHPEWTKQLHDMTTAAAGRYYPAAEGETLMKSLRSAVYGTPDNFTVAQGDKEVGKGEFGSSMTLPEGKYRLQTDYGGKTFHQDFWINTDAVTVVVFDAEKIPADAPAIK